MNTNKIETMAGAVNVTIHKNYLKSEDSSYAKVFRNTAQMNNVIATVLQKSKNIDKATLIAAQVLFKDAILDLIAQGVSVNVFELGTLYPTACGNINGSAPSVSEIPDLSLGFTPSAEALLAVSKADIAMAKQEETEPSINIIEDLFTHLTDFTVTKGKAIRITGQRLKIAGDKSTTGLYFAPNDETGKPDNTGANWVRIEDSNFFRNTSRFLELTLPEELESGKTYTVIIKTASGRGKKINKTIKTYIFEHDVKVN